MKINRETIISLPKTDLHCHLDGGLRASTARDFLREDGEAVPGQLEEKLRVASDNADLEQYLESFELPCRLLQTAGRLERVAYELAEDAAAENIRYLEVRFAPLLHCEQGLTLDQVIESVLTGLEQAEQDYNIDTGLILTGLRQSSPEKTTVLAEKVTEYWNRGVVALDLAGAERGHPAKDHLEAFYVVRNRNINLTVHAGEDFGPESIHQAIHYCGAHRIGHGVRLREDEELLNYVNDHRIPLEICLSSNVQTRAVESYEAHPLPDYLKKGLRVSLNTDNRTVSDTTVTDEYLLAIEKFNFSLRDVRRLIINGFKSAFLSYDKKSEILEEVTLELEEQFFRRDLTVVDEL